jgi:hypothetical protein
MAVCPDPKPRGFSTTCLPVSTERYQQLIDSPALFRHWLDEAFRDTPELFPAAFAQGYTLQDDRASAQRGLGLRRSECQASGDAFSVRPSLVLPYMTARTDEAEGPLFLRSFGVPFWALARVFGHSPMFWYRLEVGLGRNSIVGTTVRHGQVPEHLLADEHHRDRDGSKNYLATTVAAGRCLGAELAQTAGADDLPAAYGVFKQEAQDVQAEYQPQTVNTDGRAATRQAWQALFPLAVILRCFVHGWLNIRARAKNLGDVFRSVSAKVWHAYSRGGPQAFRPEAAAAGRVGGPAGQGGVGAGAGGQVVPAGAGVRPGLRPPGGPPHEQHAGPGDAVDGPLLRQRPAPARVGGGLSAARAGLGAAAQLPAVAPGGGAGQRRPREPGGTVEPTPLS